MEKISIGVDIGGSHITSVGVDLENLTLLDSSLYRCDVNSNAPAEEILTAWASALKLTINACEGREIIGIGFAMPGPFDYPNGIAQFKGVKKFDSLNGINIRDEMIKRLDLPQPCYVRFVNDATCFAIGETWMGKASAYKRVMAITLGTGFGSAFLNEGVPIETGDEVPYQGCVYHLPYGSSNADDNFSTRWFVSRYAELSGKQIDGVKELTDLYLTDDEVHVLFQEFGYKLGQFLSTWLNLFKTDCLIIGGNIAKSYDYFRPAFIDSLRKHDVNGMAIFLSALGENAAIIGSARLSDNDFYTKLDISAFK